MPDPRNRQLNQLDIAEQVYPDDKKLHKKVLKRLVEEKMERAKAAGYGRGKKDLSATGVGSNKIPWDYVDFERRQSRANEEGSEYDVKAEAGSVMAKLMEAKKSQDNEIADMKANGYMVGDFPLTHSYSKFKEQQAKANEEGSDYMDEDEVEEGSLAALMLAAEKAQRYLVDDEKPTKKKGNK